MYYDNGSADSGGEISNLFAKFFRSVFRPYRQLHGCNGGGVDAATDALGSVYISSEMVLDKIKSLDAGVGAGTDEYPSYFVKNCCLSLSYPLSILYNKSIQSSIFPDLWKNSLLVPIYKGAGRRDSVRNYRGVCKLSIFAKIFEKIVVDVLMHHLKSIIIPEQHGFFPKRSVETNLVVYTEYITKALDNRSQVDCVYTEFSKAFDRVDHNLLIQKLSNVGIQGNLLRWFVSYLYNRTQLVSVNGYKSSIFVITSGVPQGSHLGPLLFLIFLNHLKHVFKYCRILLYADDVNIFKQILNIRDCVIMQMDLMAFSDYCYGNKLELNLEKCMFTSFTLNTSSIGFQYCLNNVSIRRVDSVRDLGVIFETKLSFNLHLDHLIASCNRSLGFLCRMCKNFDDEVAIKSLYYAFIHSKLNFASSVRSPMYNVHKLRLERLQNKFVRFLHFKVSNVYVTLGIGRVRSQHRIELLEHRRIKNDIIFAYKILRG